MTHLWLIGMMGAGKSAVGQRVATLRSLPFVDVDVDVAARVGCSIGQLWGTRGEQAFRDMEEAAVARIAAGAAAVVATGGGVVLRPSNVSAMRASGLVVWLGADAAVLAGRVGSGDGRPLLAGEPVGERLGSILAERHETYAAAAHATVDTANKTVDQVAEEVIARWTAS